MITIVITEVVVPNSEECMYTDLLPIEIQNVSTFVPWVKRRKKLHNIKVVFAESEKRKCRIYNDSVLHCA